VNDAQAAGASVSGAVTQLGATDLATFLLHRTAAAEAGDMTGSDHLLAGGPDCHCCMRGRGRTKSTLPSRAARDGGRFVLYRYSRGEELWLIASEGDAMAQADPPEGWFRRSTCRLVLMSDGIACASEAHCCKLAKAGGCGRGRIPRRFEPQSADHLVQMVEEGLGVSLLPEGWRSRGGSWGRQRDCPAAGR